MSSRKTKAMSVNISAGTFPTVEDAVREANAIKRWLVRLCEKRGYSCKAKIGVSENNAHSGTVVASKGGRGKPKKIFERNPNSMLPSKVEAHIHIVLFGNPADMIVAELRKHLNKKYKRSVVWSKDCSGYISNAVKYLIKQSIKTRSVDYDRQDILSADAWEYVEAIREAEEEIYKNIAFTQSEPTETAETLDNAGVSDIQKDIEELQYKSNRNPPFKDFIDISNIKSFNIKNILNIFQDISMKPITIYSQAYSQIKLYLFCDNSV